jgi:hypothetical protein
MKLPIDFDESLLPILGEPIEFDVVFDEPVSE